MECEMLGMLRSSGWSSRQSTAGARPHLPIPAPTPGTDGAAAAARENRRRKRMKKPFLDVKAEELCSSSPKTKIGSPSASRGVLAPLIHGWEEH